MKDITWGQYYPGQSIIHRLDPRTKIIITILFVVDLFAASFGYSFLLLGLWLITGVLVAQIKLRMMFRGLRAFIMILVFTAVLSVFTLPGQEIVGWGVFSITKEGVYLAVNTVLRMIMLLAGTLLLTYSTSPLQLANGMEGLLRPLGKMGLPVHDWAMMVSIALRFVPLIVEKGNILIKAQKARGADFDSGNLFKRGRALVPLFVPLFFSVWNRVDELTLAMESRCYRGGEGRTHIYELCFRTVDIVFIAVAFIMTIMVWFMR